MAMDNAVRDGQRRTSKGMSPAGVPGLTGKGGSKDMAPKKFSQGSVGDMYKKPSKMGMSLGSHRDMSSGEVGPTKQAKSDKDRYTGKRYPQPEQYSNSCGPQPTKFVS